MQRILAYVALMALALPPAVSAHDIPGDVKVQAFVKPAGTHLRLLVRVPLANAGSPDEPAPPAAMV